MTTVRVLRQGKSIVAVAAEGHTGYAPAGKDIVCAGVSALMQCLRVGLEDVVGLQGVYVVCDEKNGTMSVRWRDEGDPCVDVLAETVVKSMYGIAVGYPGTVRIIEEDNHAGVQSSDLRS